MEDGSLYSGKILRQGPRFYRILQKRGCGGNAGVWTASGLLSGKKYAVKVRKKERSENGKRFSGFLTPLAAEAELLKEVERSAVKSACKDNRKGFGKSPASGGFPHCIGWFQDERQEYLVMEYLEGKTIGACLREGKSFSFPEILRIGQEVCGILEKLHNRSVPLPYLDLSPDNVFLDRKETVWLLDLGAASSWRRRAVMEKQVMYGTPGYAAPEQYRGVAFPASDIYGTGMLLRRIWESERNLVECAKNKEKNPESMGEDPVIRLERILSCCTREDPQDRYQDAGELRRNLERLSGFCCNSDMEELQQRKV